MAMHDFICMGSTQLFGKGRERKIQNENRCLQRDLKPRPVTSRQVNQRFRPLGHDALMMICGLMSYRIVGYKLTKPLRGRVTTRVKLTMVTYMCI